MNKEQFMKELEYLLQDLSLEDREDAMNYYYDYFDEAGSDNESQVIQDLQSPKRVAAIIKEGLNGHYEEHIESGNQGFEDAYKQNYEVVDEVKKNNSFSSLKDKFLNMETRDKIILIVCICVAIIPWNGNWIPGALGHTLWFPFAVIIMFAGLWFANFVLDIAGALIIAWGVIQCLTFVGGVSNMGAGLILIGVGVIIIGCAGVLGGIAKWFFKDCIPFITDKFSSLINKGGHA